MKIEWNKVTPLSKGIALALFVALPFAGFCLGSRYGESKADIRHAEELLIEERTGRQVADPQGHEQREEFTSALQDLNGDGTADSIALATSSGQYSPNTDLKVNQAVLRISNDTSDFGGSLDDYFSIVDLDAQDDRKEIVIHDSGPSNDSTTGFFEYDGTKIVLLGIVPGNWEYNMTFDGKGTLTTSERASILDTWGYRIDYRLSPQRTLVRIPKDFYERDNTIRHVVRRALDLQRSPTDAAISLRLKPWDEIAILGCDDIKWCKVQNAAGETGWFAVHDYYIISGPEVSAFEVFTGLSNAD